MARSGDTIYWVEGRSTEGGRNVLVRRTPDGRVTDLSAAPFDVRSRVHEYGGGAFLATADSVYFTNFDDQRVYRIASGHDVQAISPPGPVRHADALLDDRHDRLILVAEDHEVQGLEPVNSLVALPLNGAEPPRTLARGADFYASPCLSPDGTRLAWLSWNHPGMPWDGTVLWTAEIQPDGAVGEPQRVAGGAAESIYQPSWSPDGVLYFVSDRSGWWNLYRTRHPEIECVLPMPAEFGRPQWVMRDPTYGFESTEQIVCCYVQHGVWHLARLDIGSGALRDYHVPYTEIRHLHVSKDRVFFQGGSPRDPLSVVQLELATGAYQVLARERRVDVDRGYLSEPRRLEFQTTHDRTAHGVFYPPANRDFQGPPDERPPLLVLSHGGPTGATSTTLDLTVQYWTSRGIAVLDVDYSGSTGYGRPYRERLDGQWGVVDVDDCERGALSLVDESAVDGRRLLIRGGSAGGFTTLAALTFRRTFRAGASRYGVSDLEALARDTHKFESRYLDRLVGPYPAERARYRARSPLHASDRLSSPVIFLQGLKDDVVPPDQAQRMVEALRRGRLPVAYLTFENERHGFRDARAIQRALEAELFFFSQILEFELVDEIEPVRIENLDVSSGAVGA